MMLPPNPKLLRPARLLLVSLAALVLTPLAPAATQEPPEASGLTAEALSAVLDDADIGGLAAVESISAASEGSAVEGTVSAALSSVTTGTTLDLSGSDATMLIIETREGGPLPALAIRSRNHSGWSPWVGVFSDEAEAPDGLAGEEGSQSSGGAVGPIWVGEGTAEVEIAQAGSSPIALVIEALTPAVPTLGEAAALREYDSLQAAQPSQPFIRPRSAWTDAPWEFENDDCEDGPLNARNVEAMVVHHTVTSNDYSPEQVPGLIQGIRRYHVNTRGWCDIAYNFMVDRFGGLWEARMGSITEPVIGGHTLGFNTATSGIAVLGTHTGLAAPTSVVESITALADWKLGQYGADPLGEVWLKSRTSHAGRLKYPDGSWVSSPRLVGHRELVTTSCPGNGLHPLIPGIRSAMAATADEAPFDFDQRKPLDSGPAAFVLDRSGNLRSAGAADTPSPWPATSGTAVATAGANGRGFVLSADGTVTGFGGASSPGYKPAGEAAVNLVASADGNQGWVLDARGTLHGFNGAATLAPELGLPGQAVAAATDRSGSAGYVVSVDGAIAGFGGAPNVDSVLVDAAIDIGLRSDGESGWVMDNSGTLYGFGDAPEWQLGAPVVARALLLDPTDRGGWVLDAIGQLHPFGQRRVIQPLTTTTGDPSMVDAFIWWHLPNDLGAKPDAAYTRGLFELFLSRPGSLTELDYWSWRISDTDRDEVATEFANSSEWAGAIVDEIYVGVLGRRPEPEGRSYWVQRLADGLRTQDLGALFYSSPEYVQAAGSNSEYVRRLYEALLHRSPDDIGLGYWVNRLESGAAAPGDIASGFYQSVESRNDRVASLYRAVLGREPDEEGRDFWAGRLQGEDDIALAVDLAVSGEFYDILTEDLED